MWSRGSIRIVLSASPARASRTEILKTFAAPSRIARKTSAARGPADIRRFRCKARWGRCESRRHLARGISQGRLAMLLCRWPLRFRGSAWCAYHELPDVALRCGAARRRAEGLLQDPEPG